MSNKLTTKLKTRISQGVHTHYARVDVENQRIYEFPDETCVDMISDSKYQALAGMYVVKARPLIEFVSKHQGIPVNLESVNHLYSGYVKHLKIAMTMRGFPGFPKEDGLKFDLFNLTRKTPPVRRRNASISRQSRLDTTSSHTKPILSRFIYGNSAMHAK